MTILTNFFSINYKKCNKSEFKKLKLFFSLSLKKPDD